jgi:hypothetical protein
VLQPLQRRFALHLPIILLGKPEQQITFFNPLDEGVTPAPPAAGKKLFHRLRRFFSHRTFQPFIFPCATICKWKASRSQAGGDPYPSFHLSFHNGISYAAYRRAWLPAAASVRLAGIPFDVPFSFKILAATRTPHGKLKRHELPGQVTIEFMSKITSTPAYGPGAPTSSTDRRHWVSSFQFDTIMEENLPSLHADLGDAGLS